MTKISALQARAHALRAVRSFFDARGYLEIETPYMRAETATDPYVESFAIRGARGDGPYYLQPSPEFPHKIFLAQHAIPIYELARVFRDEAQGHKHRREFLLLEWYQPGANYESMMEETGALIQAVAKALEVDKWRVFDDETQVFFDVACETPERISVTEAFERELGISPLSMSRLELIEAAKALGSRVANDWSWNDCFNLLLLDHIESKLGRDRPCFLYDYPASMASLAKTRKNADGNPVSERFELYIAGLELCNGYSELNDPNELRQRFEADNAERQSLGLQQIPIDEALLLALPSLKTLGGNALGVERLLMCALGCRDICDVRID